MLELTRDILGPVLGSASILIRGPIDYFPDLSNECNDYNALHQKCLSPYNITNCPQ